MKKNVFKSITLITLMGTVTLAFSQNQKNEEALVKIFNDVWTAYEKGDEQTMWNFYSSSASEIYPDGSLISGKENIRQAYNGFKNMLEGNPKWKYSRPTVRFIEPNVALLFSDIESDIKLKGGQQMGGKVKFVAVLHRVNGKWQIEFDGQVPKIPMPEMGK
jgi:uncharacterized protein (TIGR02246 family)